MNRFSFITDPALQSNLENTFDYIVFLTSLTESEEYQEQSIIVSSFRKTIIIHTASIIEAILLWKLKQISNTTKIELPDEWKYSVHVLYEIDYSNHVIAGTRKKEQKELDRMDLANMIKLVKEYSVVKTHEFIVKLDKIRIMRNQLHIGTIQEIEREYKKEDLEFCFSVMKSVVKLVKK